MKIRSGMKFLIVMMAASLTASAWLAGSAANDWKVAASVFGFGVFLMILVAVYTDKE